MPHVPSTAGPLSVSSPAPPSKVIARPLARRDASSVKTSAPVVPVIVRLVTSESALEVTTPPFVTTTLPETMAAVTD